MDDASKPSSCLIECGLVRSAEAVLFGTERGPMPLWGMRCLSMLIEAVCLYDELLVYEPHPLYPLFFNYPYLAKHAWIRLLNPYESKEERGKAIENLQGADDDLPIGRMLGAPFLDFPTSYWKKNAIRLRNFPDSVIRESMKTMGLPDGRPDFWECATEEFTRNLAIQFAASKTWQLECARAARKKYEANGLLLTPSTAPFFLEDRRRLQSLLHANFNDVQKALAESVVPDADISLDVSPLTWVALDGAFEREGLWENILRMREDYAGLREIASMFSRHLASAERNDEVAGILREWRDGWSGILAKISNPAPPLRYRLFGWDVLKKGSMRGILLEAADIIGKEWRDIQIERGLSLVREFRAEVYFARPFSKRVEELFGGPLEEG
jgi:hypothetical protein